MVNISTGNLTQLQKAEYAAQQLAEACYRGCSAWTVVSKKTYGVRSLFKDIQSDLVKEIIAEKGTEQIRDSISVVPDLGHTQFTPDEAYLIARSLCHAEPPRHVEPSRHPASRHLELPQSAIETSS